jgi:hypothetical protein
MQLKLDPANTIIKTDQYKHFNLFVLLRAIRILE